MRETRDKLRQYVIHSFCNFQVERRSDCPRETAFWKWFFMMYPGSGFRWRYNLVYFAAYQYHSVSEK